MKQLWKLANEQHQIVIRFYQVVNPTKLGPPVSNNFGGYLLF